MAVEKMPEPDDGDQQNVNDFIGQVVNDNATYTFSSNDIPAPALRRILSELCKISGLIVVPPPPP